MKSSKERKISKATKNTSIKVRNCVTWLKIMIVVMKIKWFTLL